MNAALPGAVKRYTLAEIAEAKGVSRQALSKRANKERWLGENVSCPGGHQRFFALTNLPKDIQKALTDKAINAVMPVIAQEIAAPIVARIPEAMLTSDQRLERDARLGVINAIAKTMEHGRCSKEAAMNTLLVSARTGALDELTSSMLRHARDPRGRSGDGFPSIRTLKRWLSANDLTPRRPQKNLTPPEWAKDFLALWQQPQKPSVDHAYQIFSRQWPDVSIHQCRRFIAKMGAVSRERGRMGPRELKNIRPFIRRDSSMLEPNQVWTADGHRFDALVQHPATGKAFRPEIQSIIDVATRKCVGWSANVAESAFTVLDAIRYGVERNGIPAIFYVDNGAGYKNVWVGKEATGLVSRLGTTITHSLPYNSQAKGVVERSHQSIWIRAAKMLESYIGAKMDREAKLLYFKTTQKAIKNGGAMPVMPWHVFMQFCEAAVNDYNQRQHRSLGGVSPDLKWEEFEAKGFEAMRLTNDELETLFRPHVARVVDRGQIRLFNNIYFSKVLEEFHGDTIFAAFDIHNPQTIWIQNEDGQLICTAEANGNRRAYFPQSFNEQAKDKRLDAQLKRNDVHRKRMIEERTGAPAIAAPASSELIIGGRVVDIDKIPRAAQAPEPVTEEPEGINAEFTQEVVTEAPTTPAKPRSERSAQDNYAEWLEVGRRLADGEPVGEADAFWHQSYQRTAQFRAMQKKTAAV